MYVVTDRSAVGLWMYENDATYMAKSRRYYLLKYRYTAKNHCHSTQKKLLHIAWSPPCYAWTNCLITTCAHCSRNIWEFAKVRYMKIWRSGWKLSLLAYVYYNRPHCGRPLNIQKSRYMAKSRSYYLQKIVTQLRLVTIVLKKIT